MSERVTMPALGESVTEGTVTRWLKNVGDAVEVDEPLLEVSTDKVDTEIPSPVAGTLQEILVQEDDTVPVGADLAVIGDGARLRRGDPGAGPAAAGAGADAAAARGGRARPARPRAPSSRARETEPSERRPSRRAQQPQRQPRPADRRVGGRAADGHDARARRVGHRGHGHPVAQGRGRRRRGRRAAARGLDGQGRHRDPVARRRQTDQDLVQEDETVPVGGDLAVIGGGAGGGSRARGRS